MKTLTKKSLEEMAKLMYVIPKADLNGFVGGEGCYQEFKDECLLRDFLDAWHDEYEAIYIFYSDGTCGVYIDDRNYCDDEGCYSYFDYGITSNANGDTLYNFPGYSNGRYISAWGHTHPSNSATGGDPSPKDDLNALPGIPKYIWYDGDYHPY